MEKRQRTPSKKKVKSTALEVYIFPLTRRPCFPGMAVPMLVEPGPFYEVLKQIAVSEEKTVGLLMTKEETANIQNVTVNDLVGIGVLAQVLRIIPGEGGGAQVILNVTNRFSVVEPVPDPLLLKLRVEPHKDALELTDQIKAYTISIISTIKDLLKLNPLFKEELQLFLGHSEFTEPGKLADFSVNMTTATRLELQDILETLPVQERLEKALFLLKKEHDLSQLQLSISQKIDSTVSQKQKEFFLREQLKAIKKELGLEKEEKSLERDKLTARLKDKTVPDHVMSVIQEELEKFSLLEPHSSEYGVVRNYLDWLTILPWGIYHRDQHTLAHAEEILHQDHYGLEDIKERILEFISVEKLTANLKGNILCLVGPPGVGKTSIGKSVARALNRKFYRFSVGGMRDEAEIKGHRRTYVGAMPGKLIQALKYCQSMNPVIMLDEVDKMGASYHGDPASALLEVLDSEQNNEFLDHYLDVRCDLSGILFIVTANVLDTIPSPLRDRMEVLRLSGYIQEEKVAIAQRYLIPKNCQQMGLNDKKIAFSDGALAAIIDGYAREAGVRSLENYLKKILRKIATALVKSEKKQRRTLAISAEKVSDYLGKPMHSNERFYPQTPVGVCTGLAWTALGGAILYIETVKVQSDKPKLMLTGQAGAVMRESSDIAWSYLQSTLNHYAPNHLFFDKASVHMHVPEGAVPKDGPSAGITMATALLSLLTDTPVREGIAMTGELTLTGRILAIGGLKEKIIAARRASITTILFPKDNVRDYDELPAYLKNGLKAHFVQHFDEVHRIAFPLHR